MIHLSGRRLRSGLFCAVLSLLSAATVKADRFAYLGGEDGSFGAINLQTGEYTLLGNSEKTLFGLGVANGLLFATTYDDAAPLYTVNPSNGALTFVGNGGEGIHYYAFGSTTSGLFGLDDTDGKLYSVNPETGAATLVGNTGITEFPNWTNLSAGGDTLYFANATKLYSINTATAEVTEIGDTQGPEIGALVYEDGILYGGQNSTSAPSDTCESNCGPPPCGDCQLPGAAEVDGLFIVSLSTTTGLPTGSNPVVGTTSAFYALAPADLSGAVATPEPSTGLLAGFSAAMLLLALRRKTRGQSV